MATRKDPIVGLRARLGDGWHDRDNWFWIISTAIRCSLGHKKKPRNLNKQYTLTRLAPSKSLSRGAKNDSRVYGGKMGTPGYNGYSYFSSTCIVGVLFLCAIHFQDGSKEKHCSCDEFNQEIVILILPQGYPFYPHGSKWLGTKYS